MTYESVQKLIKKVANHYAKNNQPLFEEFFSVGNEEYCRVIASDAFDPTYGVKFSTFLTRSVASAIRNYIRSEKRGDKYGITDKSATLPNWATMGSHTETNVRVLDVRNVLNQFAPEVREKLLALADKQELTFWTLRRAGVDIPVSRLQSMFSNCR